MVCGALRSAIANLTEKEASEIIRKIITDEGYDVHQITFDEEVIPDEVGKKDFHGISVYVSNVMCKIKK